MASDQAINPDADARDFRLETLGPKYESTTLMAQEKGIYLAKVEKPAKGWTAFFAELTFPNTGPAPFKFTTEVRIVPEVVPFKFREKAAK